MARWAPRKKPNVDSLASRSVRIGMWSVHMRMCVSMWTAWRPGLSVLACGLSDSIGMWSVRMRMWSVRMRMYVSMYVCVYMYREREGERERERERETHAHTHTHTHK